MDNINYYFNNENFYRDLQSKYENLAELKFENNTFYYLEFSLNIGNFDLRKIPFKAYNLYPYDLLNIIKINMDIEDEMKYLETNGYNLNYLYMKIRTILVKNVLSGQDELDLSKFIEAYVTLMKYQDYLTTTAKEKFNIMAGIVRDMCYVENLNTPGVNIIKERLDEENGRNSNMGLRLVNPNYKGSINDSNNGDDVFFSKTGFVSIISISLYILANIGFIIATLILK